MANKKLESIKSTPKMEEYFRNLKDHIGEEIVIEYGVIPNRTEKEEGILKRVNKYSNIVTTEGGTPFLGQYTIINVFDKEGDVLYNNPLAKELIEIINDPRENRTIDEVREDIASRCYGQEVGDFIRRKNSEMRRIGEELERSRVDRAQKNIPKYLKKGKRMIKEDKWDVWEKFVRANTSQGYSAEIVDASVEVMKDLSKGKSLEDACRTLKDSGASNYSASLIAQTVARFHPQGEEFKKHFQKKYTA
jgi:hypothetical protein